MSEIDRQPEDIDLYKLLGGSETCLKLSAAFYGRVALDPVLRAIFPGSFHCAINSLACFLAQLLGGPNDYSKSRPWLSLREAHERFRIGPAERDAWLRTMLLALDAVEIEEPARQALRQFFEQSSMFLVNHPDHLCDESILASKTRIGDSDDPAAACIHQKIAEQWSVQRTLDEIVAAVRSGDATRAIALMETSTIQDHIVKDRAAYLNLLAVMACSDTAALFEYVRRHLEAEPALARERHVHGRTLLHDAASAGTLPFVTLLLRLDSDPNATDNFGHTPLYAAGNGAGTADIIRALTQVGANMDAQDRIKRCAALHMAARRGNLPVAEALLDCGANLEVRDRQGQTPLRRAVNCAKPDMAAFLVSRGADVNSKDSKGVTPQQAARGATMKRLFAGYAGGVESS